MGVEDRDLPAIGEAISTMIQHGGMLDPVTLLKILKDQKDPAKLAGTLQDALSKFLADPANREKIGAEAAKRWRRPWAGWRPKAVAASRIRSPRRRNPGSVQVQVTLARWDGIF